VGHLTQSDAREPELAQDRAGPAVDGVAVSQSSGARVAGESVQLAHGLLALGRRPLGVDGGPLEIEPSFRVAGDHSPSLRISRNLALLGHRSLLLTRLDVLPDKRIDHRETSGDQQYQQRYAHRFAIAVSFPPWRRSYSRLPTVPSGPP
jgi:hypothetical protein